MMEEMLLERIQKVLETAVFRTRGMAVNAEEFKELYLVASGINRILTINAEVQVDDIRLESLESAVRETLKEYIDSESDRFGNGLCDLVWGERMPTVKSFTERVIRAGAISGAAKTAEKIVKWSEGEPFLYVHEVLLGRNGNMEKGPAIRLEEGIGVELLPESYEETARRIPSGIAHALKERSNYLDLFKSAVLLVECEWNPVFRRIEGERRVGEVRGEARWGRGKFRMTDSTAEELCQSMAIIAGKPISWKMRWDNFGEDEVFCEVFAGADRLRERERSFEFPHTAEYLKDVWNFHAGREAAKKSMPEVERAIRRWNKSQHALGLEDRAIEMRIALETLFLDEKEGRGELGFRMALHAAWEVGRETGEKQKWFDVARKAYGVGSRAVHGGGIKSKNVEESKRAVEEGQKLCSEGIKMRIKSGVKPEWDKEILS